MDFQKYYEDSKLYVLIGGMINESICNAGFNRDNRHVLEAIQSEYREMLASLLTKESIDNMDLFCESVNELFACFKGKVESYDDWGGPTVATSLNHVQVTQTMEPTYEVKITEYGYRFAILCTTIDTETPIMSE